MSYFWSVIPKRTDKNEVFNLQDFKKFLIFCNNNLARWVQWAAKGAKDLIILNASNYIIVVESNANSFRMLEIKLLVSNDGSSSRMIT